MKKAFFVFKIYYLLYVLVAFTALLNGCRFMNAATLLLSVGGAALVLGMMIQFRLYLKAKNIWLVLLFLLSYVFSSLMTFKYGITDNIKELLWLIFPMLLLYIAEVRYSAKEMQKEFKILSAIYVLYSTIAGAVSISMLFWGRNFTFQDESDSWRTIGFKWGRLWGVFDDPNHGATILVAGIVLAVYLILVTKNKALRVCWGLTALIQYIYIIFSDSRTGQLALAFAVFIGGALAFNRTFQNKGRLPRIALSVVLAALLSAVVIGITFEVKQAYNIVDKKIQIQELKQSRAQSQAQSAVPKEKEREVGRKKDLEKDVSNGRISIWKSGLEIAKASPIYGVSFRNMTAYAQKNLPDTYLVNNPGEAKYDSLHNAVMDILVSQGLIGIIIAAAILVNTILYIRKRWKYTDKEIYTLQCVCLAVILAMGTASMFISMVFYLNSPQTYIFWLCLGYFIFSIKKKEQ